MNSLSAAAPAERRLLELLPDKLAGLAERHRQFSPSQRRRTLQSNQLLRRHAYPAHHVGVLLRQPAHVVGERAVRVRACSGSSNNNGCLCIRSYI